jgi:hypothetical protein
MSYFIKKWIVFISSDENRHKARERPSSGRNGTVAFSHYLGAKSTNYMLISTSSKMCFLLKERIEYYSCCSLKSLFLNLSFYTHMYGLTSP